MKKHLKRIRVRESYTWSDIAELMEQVATRIEREAVTQAKLAAMHRALARDLRAMVRGKLAVGSL